MNHFAPSMLIIFFLTTIIATTTCSYSATTEPTPNIQKSDDSIIVKLAAGSVRLQVWSDRIIRVTFTTSESFPADRSLSVIAKPQVVKWDSSASTDAITLKTAEIQARIDLSSGAISFMDSQGNVFLSELAGARSMEPVTIQGEASWKMKQSFNLAQGEAIYGLGQHPDGVMNYVGHKTVRLLQQNTMVGIPVLMSSRGYGILWDNPSVTEISTTAADAQPGTLQWSSEAGDAIDYYVMYGPELDTAIGGYRTLTGAAPMFGKWAYGFWQSKERYSSQDELLWIVDQYRKRNIPIDGIIQDWQYWAPQPWGSHAIDKSRYYDFKGMMKQLHENNIHLLISVWAKFEAGSKNYKELESNGALYDQVINHVFPAGQGKWYDPFNPKARELYWKQMSRELFSQGIDGWWLDATEPELGGKWGEFRDYKTAGGPGARVFNAYPLMTTTAVYQGQRAETDAKRAIILTRSAYAGQQRNAAITWSGDIHATWDVFTKQIPAGINFSLSGIPYWNTDIGGFFGSNPARPEYRELFTRWFQFGAFCPMFRVHGTDIPKEIWRFEGDTYKTLVKYDQLRYRLLPYIYSTAWNVTNSNSTMMRALVMDFRNDPKVLNITDQYLFGPSIMVNPVTKAGATSRNVYLPAESLWYDFWTGKSSPGGQSIDGAAPIDTLPLFIRAGSILPMGPLVQSAMEPSTEPIDLRIYPGADGSFTLYDDEGDNYNYEKGAHSTIVMSWNDAKSRLTIGPREGEFPGMKKEIAFRVTRVTENVGIGLTSSTDTAVIHYSGQSIDTILNPK